MKLGAALTIVGLGLSMAALGIGNQACGSDDGGSTSSSSSGSTSSAQTGKVWPEEEGSATSSTDEKTFAVNAIHLGEADRSGTKNKDAWKKFGYNLDNLITNVTDQTSPDLAKVCKRAEGAVASIHQDGDEGTDNTFGKEILKLLDPFTPTPSKSLSTALTDGSFTLLLSIKGLSSEATQTNTGLSGTLLVGADYGETKPAFDDTTDWPYINDPKVAINGAYINNGVFVNGATGATVSLSLSFSGQTLSLTIQKAIITFKHNPASKMLEDGTIAGIINTEELIDGIGKVAGRFSTDLCQGKTVEGIKDQIRTASDIMANGTQNPGANCDGISVGIGFTAKQVAKPTKEVVPGEPTPDPCTAQ